MRHRKTIYNGQLLLFMTWTETNILRSKFGNAFLKNRTEENINNYPGCATLLLESKREYFILGILMRKTWSVVKPLLSNNVFSNEIETLVEDKKVINNDKKQRQLIPQYNETEPLSHYSSSNLCFSFSQIERDDIIKETNNRKTNKTTHSTDIPTKLIKENSDILADFIFANLYNCPPILFFQRH